MNFAKYWPYRRAYAFNNSMVIDSDLCDSMRAELHRLLKHSDSEHKNASKSNHETFAFADNHGKMIYVTFSDGHAFFGSEVKEAMW